MEKFELNTMIGVSHMQYGVDTETHVHDAIEIVYILSGKGYNIIDGEKFYIKKGTLLWIDQTQTHRFDVLEPIAYFNINFKPELISNVLNNNSSVNDIFNYLGYDKFFLQQYILCDDNEQEKVETYCENIMKEMLSMDSGYLNMAKSNLELLLHFIARKCIKKDAYVGVRESETLLEAIQYIQNNCSQELKLDEISGKYNFSPNYFSKLIKKCTGLSFKQFLVKKRMVKAMRLLLENNENHTVEYIMNECGYSNKTYFYNTFREQFGVLPKDIKNYTKNYKINLNKKFIEKNI